MRQIRPPKRLNGEHVVLNINHLVEPDYYSRKPISQEEIENLKKSLKSLGQMDGVIVNLRDDNYFIVNGNQIVQSMKELGFKNVRAFRICEDIEKEKEIHLRMNRAVAEFSWETTFMKDFEKHFEECGYSAEIDDYHQDQARKKKKRNEKKGSTSGSPATEKFPFKFTPEQMGYFIERIKEWTEVYGLTPDELIMKLFKDHEENFRKAA